MNNMWLHISGRKAYNVMKQHGTGQLATATLELHVLLPGSFLEPLAQVQQCILGLPAHQELHPLTRLT